MTTFRLRRPDRAAGGFVSGFAPDSAAVALFAWLRHRGDFRATVEALVSAGGDTDTVAFIGGALAGSMPVSRACLPIGFGVFGIG